MRGWADYREPDGSLLPRRTAGSELLNVLRPTVAVDRFIVFPALALHRNPDWTQRLRDGTDVDVEHFVQEVRRTTPFFPAVGALALRPFRVEDTDVPAGRLVVLDLHGSNHHPAVWTDPDRFDPDRFAGHRPGPYDLVPQGGGEHRTGHRCPGEWIVIALMTAALRLLTREMTYAVPEQDLSVRLDRVPAIPPSRMVLDRVRLAT